MAHFFSALGSLLIAISIIVVMSFVLSWPVWILWNGCLVGAVAGINTVTWMQAWGISLLCGFLFKSSTTNSAT